MGNGPWPARRARRRLLRRRGYTRRGAQKASGGGSVARLVKGVDGAWGVCVCGRGGGCRRAHTHGVLGGPGRRAAGRMQAGRRTGERRRAAQVQAHQEHQAPSGLGTCDQAARGGEWGTLGPMLAAAVKIGECVWFSGKFLRRVRVLEGGPAVRQRAGERPTIRPLHKAGQGVVGRVRAGAPRKCTVQRRAHTNEDGGAQERWGAWLHVARRAGSAGSRPAGTRSWARACNDSSGRGAGGAPK